MAKLRILACGRFLEMAKDDTIKTSKKNFKVDSQLYWKYFKCSKKNVTYIPAFL